MTITRAGARNQHQLTILSMRSTPPAANGGEPVGPDWLPAIEARRSAFFLVAPASTSGGR